MNFTRIFSYGGLVTCTILLMQCASLKQKNKLMVRKSFKKCKGTNQS